jgi:transposase InsO family protein
VRRKPIEGWAPDAAIQDAEIARLAERQACQPGGRLPRGETLESASQLRLSPSQVRRKIQRVRNGVPLVTARTRFEIGPEERKALIDAKARFKVAHELLERRGWPGRERGVTYPHFWKAVRRDVDIADLLFWRGGDAAARAGELKLRFVAEDVMALTVDAKWLSIWVRHPVTGEKTQPCVLHAKWFIPRFVSRPVCSFSAPTQYHVARVLRNALMPDPDWGPDAGLPDLFAHDNGSEYLSDDLSLTLSRLVLLERLSDSFQPQQNGSVESYHDFIEDHYCVPHPFFAHGPTRFDNSAYLPDLDLVPDWETFVSDYADVGGFVWRYNHDYRDHEALDGNTPAEAWRNMPIAPPPVDAAAIRWLGRKPYRTLVRDIGVEVCGDLYQCRGLRERIGKYVIALVDESRQDAEIYDEDERWACVAINQKRMSDRDRLHLLGDRRKQRTKRRTEKRLATEALERLLASGQHPQQPPQDHQARIERFRSSPPSGFNRAIGAPDEALGRAEAGADHRDSRFPFHRPVD